MFWKGGNGSPWLIPGFISDGMASLIETYEQQYASLTAEITHNINNISSTRGGIYD